GLSPQAGSYFSDFACLVRFGLNGNIDVRNGGTYGADLTYSYAANTKYHFSVLADVGAHTCTVKVLGPTGPEVVLANNYQFRTEQAGATSLSNFGFNVDSTGGGSLTVCRYHVTPPSVVFSEQFDGTGTLASYDQYTGGNQYFPADGFSATPGA